MKLNMMKNFMKNNLLNHAHVQTNKFSIKGNIKDTKINNF